MKFNKWTTGLAAVGVVSLASAARADETMSMVNTALSQTTLSGYVDVAAEYNAGDGRNSAFLPSGSNMHPDGFSLNAVDVALDKPEDNSQWASGYHIEGQFGADSVGVGNAGEATIRQAFIRLRTPVGNGIDWQFGVFDDIIGYESNTDGANPNYTRSYGYAIEPTTLLGILGTYKICDEVTVSGGIANGAVFSYAPTPQSVYPGQLTYMGAITLTAPDSMGFMKGATLTAGVVRSLNSAEYGPEVDNYLDDYIPVSFGATCNWYVGATIPTPLAALKLGASFDYVNLSAYDHDTDSHTGLDIWDVAGYLTYQATDKLSFNLRGEFLDNWNDLGVYTPLPGVSPDPGYGLISYNGLTDQLSKNGSYAEELTATIQYNIWANVMSRVEFRWDHVDNKAFGSEYEGEGEDDDYDYDYNYPDKENSFMLALNLIYTF